MTRHDRGRAAALLENMMDAHVNNTDRPAQGVDGSGGIPADILLPVKVDEHEDRRFRIRGGGTLKEIVRVVATERGCAIEELAIFRDGEREEIALVVVIEEGDSRRRHHVHARGAVGVTVFYGAGSQERAFERRDTVEDVRAWAVRVFGIDASMAPEFELARHGTTAELPDAEHVGHLAGRHHALQLNLIRGAIANGASS